MDAYIHVSAGEPGVDPGTGWSREMDILVRDASVAAAPTESFLWITEGSVEIEGVAQESLPLPFEAEGQVTLHWSGAEGALLVRGRGLSVVPLGEPVFVEQFPGSGDSR